MLEYINKYVTTVNQSEILKESPKRTVYLINNKLVVYFSSQIDQIFEWYIDNQMFAPSPVFGGEKHICYDFLVPTSDDIKIGHIRRLFIGYKPKFSHHAGVSYFTHLEAEYEANCFKLGLEVKSYERPSIVHLFKLHGSMDYNNTMVHDDKLILLDPSPIEGPIIVDLIQFYLSDEHVRQLISIPEICSLLDITEQYFYYYYTLILARKLVAAEGQSDYQDLSELYSVLPNAEIQD